MQMLRKRGPCEDRALKGKDGGTRDWQMQYWGNTFTTHFMSRCDVACLHFLVDVGDAITIFFMKTRTKSTMR